MSKIEVSLQGNKIFAGHLTARDNALKPGATDITVALLRELSAGVSPSFPVHLDWEAVVDGRKVQVVGTVTVELEQK